MPLKASREIPLCIYTYIVRPGVQLNVNVQQDVNMVVAFTDEEAFLQVRNKYPAGVPLSIDHKGKIPMENFLQFIGQVTDLSAVIPQVDSKNQDKELEWLVKTKQDYYVEIINGMLKGDLSAFVEKPENKPILEAALRKMLAIVEPAKGEKK
jgi:hypothetical protein